MPAARYTHSSVCVHSPGSEAVTCRYTSTEAANTVTAASSPANAVDCLTRTAVPSFTRKRYRIDGPRDQVARYKGSLGFRGLYGSPVERALTRARPGFSMRRGPGTGLLITGLVAFVAVIASYLAYKFTHSYVSTSAPVDLHVYRIGGLIVRHTRPYYNPHRSTPL